MNDETFKCEHCGGVMTPQDETCPSCGKQQGVNQPRESYDELLAIIDRLHGERDAALAGVEDTKRLRGILGAVAEALAEGAMKGHAGAFEIEHDLAWFYKARAALGAAGYAIDHPVPDDHPQHAARWVQATSLVEHIDPHAHLFWSTHAADAEGERPAFMKLTGDLCQHCEGFGGGPERIRLLGGKLVEREAQLGQLATRLDAVKASHLELSNAAQQVAATNEAQMSEILRLRTALEQREAEMAKMVADAEQRAKESAEKISAADEAAETKVASRLDELDRALAELREQLPAPAVTPKATPKARKR